MEIALIGVIGTKIFGESSSTMQGLSLFIGVYMILGFVVFIDLITLGGFKRVKEKHFAAVYYYIYRFYSMVTFSFLYRLYCIILLTIRTLKIIFSIYTLHRFDPPGASRHRKQYPPYIPEFGKLDEQGLMVDDYYYDDTRNVLLQEFPNEERHINKNMPVVSLEQFRVTQRPRPCLFR